MKLFGVEVDPETGRMAGADKLVRRLSDMRGYYHDTDAFESLLPEDPVIYEVYSIEQEERPGDLNFATTVLHPGVVGDEFYMTKGHFHSKSDRSELYLCLKGRGLMLTQSPEGEAAWLEMAPMTVVYVPPHHAHRTINTGDEDLIFLAVYPADAGHDYGSIAERGFPVLVLRSPSGFEIVENPAWS